MIAGISDRSAGAMNILLVVRHSGVVSRFGSLHNQRADPAADDSASLGVDTGALGCAVPAAWIHFLQYDGKPDDKVSAGDEATGDVMIKFTELK